MSIDPKFGRYCDGCGNLMANAHKLYLGSEYCGNCYKRLFEAAACVHCNGRTIAHKNQMEPVCSACTASMRTCLRCEKPVPRAGLVFNERPVCPSCVPYFKEPEQCARCERVTSRLSTMPSAGIFENICDSCRNRHTHATCSVCRKYRKVGSRREDAAAICTDCARDSTATHACPDCKVQLPGRGKSRCRACLNRIALEREVRLTAALFRQEWVAMLWSRFAIWMHARGPANPKLLGMIQRHQPFFERIDAGFASAMELTGAVLLQMFGTAALRRHPLPVAFLAEQLDVHVHSEDKEDVAEFSRINEILISAKRTPWSELLHAYHRALVAGELALRSVRMYLSNAAMFCASANVESDAWSDGALERYLEAKPGARNSLSRFVSFCRKSQGWDVHMPAKWMLVRPLADPVRSARKLRDLIRKADSAGMQNAPRDVLVAILAEALGFARATVASSKATDFRIGADAVVYCRGKEQIRIPQELEPYARRLAELIADPR